MKPHLLQPLLFGTLWLCACDSEKPVATVESMPISPSSLALAEEDTPLLPVKPGDAWNYSVAVEIAPGVTAPDAEALSISSERVRTYLGKVSPGGAYPEVDCFEVTTADVPAEREFVEIHDNRIMMRGSLTMAPERLPVWYDKPLPFIIAGLRAGSQFQEIGLAEGAYTRKIQVIGRETVTVPAGTFDAVRLLMSGKDRDFELRRTIWFSPRNGIVREENARYATDKLLFREVHELTSFSPGG